MKIQINSDKTIAVDAKMMRFVEDKVRRALRRFTMKLTRVEIHLSDVDGRKTGQQDKRCLIEARPAGARPLVASANATKLAPAVVEASDKMQRVLTTFFGRMGRTPKKIGAKKKVASKTTVRKEEKAVTKKAAVKRRKSASQPEPKKKWIYQARRKAWPAR
jgi:Sigma 54 modulation protein / S30EA ribosomal protein